MRWILSTVLILIATPAFAQENEAEKLFRAMEKNIKEAKSLKVRWDAEKPLGASEDSVNPKGILLLADGNKARVEFEGSWGSAPLPWYIVSDGKKTSERWGNQEDQKNSLEPTLPLLNQNFTDMVRRPGFIAGQFIIPFFAGMRKEKIEFDKMAVVTDFKMGAKERIGDREAQIINYAISIYGAGELEARVWIDAAQLIPLKRNYAIANQSVITEIYSEFIINPELDPKLFELPK